MPFWKALLRFLSQSGGNVAQRTVRSIFWAGSSNALANLLRFAGQVIVARLLFPDQIGLMGIALFFLRALDVLSQPGLSAAIIHRRDRIEESIDAAWSALILRGLLLAGLILAAAPFVARFYEEPVLAQILRVISIVYVIQGLTNSHLILLRKELDFRRLAAAELAAAVAQLVTVAVLAYLFRSVWALVVGQIVLASVRVLASFVVTGARPRLSFNWPLVGELLRYGKFVTGTTIVSYFTTGIDKAVAGKVLGMTPLGHYVYAQSLSGLPVNTTEPILQRILFPALSKLQKQPEDLRRFFLKTLRLVATAVLPMTAGIAVLAPEIVAGVYGPKWLPMLDAVYVLCAFSLLRALSAATHPLFLATGRPQVGFYLSGLKLALIAILVYPLTSNYGIAGTAAAITFPALVEQAALQVLARRVLQCSLGTIVGQLPAPLLATGIMAGGVWWWKGALAAHGAPLVLCTAVALGATVYLGLVLLLDPGLARDALKQLKQALASSGRDLGGKA